MKLLIFLFFNVYAKDILALPIKIDSRAKDKTIILTEIVSNYLHRYFHNAQVCFSIASSSSSVDEKYFQNDLIRKLVKEAEYGHFLYNFVDMLDQWQTGNINSFNLIFVDDKKSLM